MARQQISAIGQVSFTLDDTPLVGNSVELKTANRIEIETTFVEIKDLLVDCGAHGKFLFKNLHVKLTLKGNMLPVISDDGQTVINFEVLKGADTPVIVGGLK